MIRIFNYDNSPRKKDYKEPQPERINDSPHFDESKFGVSSNRIRISPTGYTIYQQPLSERFANWLTKWKKRFSVMLRIFEILVLLYLLWSIRDLSNKVEILLLNKQNVQSQTLNNSLTTPQKSVKAGVFQTIVDEKGIHYDTLVVDIIKTPLKIFFKDKNGKRIGSFNQLRSDLASERQDLVFALNAGIFETDWKPLGLHIENGKSITPLNRENQLNISPPNQYGNFYLIPNGVFLIKNNKASILETSNFERNFNKIETYSQISLATQSGPLLLSEGKINPRFVKDSENLKVRNGVGVIDENHVVFIISRDRVNFFDFASVFKDKFSCENALYLDGTISQMYLPEINKEISEEQFVGILAVSIPNRNSNMP